MKFYVFAEIGTETLAIERKRDLEITRLNRDLHGILRFF